MKTEWNLDKIYKGIDDPEYLNDVNEYKELGKKFEIEVNGIENEISITDVEKILEIEERLSFLLLNLNLYLELRLSTDAENGALIAENNKLMRLYSATVATSTKATKLLSQIPDINEFALKSKIIEDYRFYLEDIKEKAKHMLSDGEEEMYVQMDMTGGSAWGNLQDYLTSTVKVDYQGKILTLTEIRNLANDMNSDIRKNAYEAELKSYEKIADSVAYALNNIKLQVNMIAEKRKYASPLDMTLRESYMKRETLDAMLEAIKDHLPKLREYLKHKAKLLGYEGGIKWYDLGAPLVKEDKKYSIEETKNILLNTFVNFSPEMSELMKEAFENEWIDFMPRKGKTGGAFDAGCSKIKESRILTNFDGSFSAIDTLAHELGHAFHDRQVLDNRQLNQGYPMPVAETASTLNEIFLCNECVAKSQNDSEKLNLLEMLLKEQIQCVVDIYSRYLFETAVFDRCNEEFLLTDQLKELMLDAQKKAYGDGLDESCMHPFMWVCKGHYYSSGLSFYNFPYAFGVLFASGLYDLFLKEGKDIFIPKYKKMLKETPCITVEEAGELMGIDLTKKSFWENSLMIIEKQIEEFCRL